MKVRSSTAWASASSGKRYWLGCSVLKPPQITAGALFCTNGSCYSGGLGYNRGMKRLLSLLACFWMRPQPDLAEDETEEERQIRLAFTAAMTGTGGSPTGARVQRQIRGV
jgi:hypothetical protein